MSIRAVTFNEQACKSEDDALIHDLFLNNHCGPIKDCELSYDTNTITVGQGYFMIAGRLVHINGNEVIEPTPVENGTKYCKLIFSLDMTKENTAKDFKQGKFEVIGNYDTYPDTTQEDLHNGGTTYQLEVCKFTLTPEGITSHENIWYPVEINGVVAYAKKEVDAMIAEYEAECDEIIKNASMPVSHIHETVTSDQGVHGLRYNGILFETYNTETQEWETAAGGLPPRPVTEILAINGTTKVDIMWNEPNIYDVQISGYNVYVAHASAKPTDISQFNLLTTIQTTTYTYTTNSPSNCYVLITPISSTGIENTDISYITPVITTPTFSSASWSVIDMLEKKDKLSTYFSVGDVKTITIGGKSQQITIYGFKHDDLSDGTGKAKMTLGLVNCLPTTYAMNSSDTNVGGWTGSKMYSTLNDAIFGDLPEELKGLIKPVKKKTSAGNKLTTINTSNDKLFLFSEHEIFGAKTYSVGNEGTQYSLFATSSNRIKKLGDSGSANLWWERSPCASDATLFCLVSSSGAAGGNNASGTFGVCFGFCI